MKKVGYLGPRGSFTEAAVRKYTANDLVELICYQRLSLIVSAVENSELDEGVVPLENSTEGAVNQILDLITQTPGIKFRGEVIMNIHHNLLAKPGTEKSQISRVFSHPQALAQCREYLARKFPYIETEDTNSTAQAASIVATSGNSWAAIGANLAAEEYGLEILDKDIHDSSENATRFVVLSRRDADFALNSRTSLIVAEKDRPGALYGILREFALREINLTRIESRPGKKRLGQYIFFVDMDGHRNEPVVKEAIEAISGKAAYLRVLGSYPRDNSLIYRDEAGDERKSLSLQEVRGEIDLVDSQIVELIALRTKLVEKIGFIKNNPAMIRDAGREEEVIGRVRSDAVRKGADADMIESIYRHMISCYVKMQKGRFLKKNPPQHSNRG